MMTNKYMFGEEVFGQIWARGPDDEPFAGQTLLQFQIENARAEFSRAEFAMPGSHGEGHD